MSPNRTVHILGVGEIIQDIPQHLREIIAVLRVIDIHLGMAFTGDLGGQFAVGDVKIVPLAEKVEVQLCIARAVDQGGQGAALDIQVVGGVRLDPGFAVLDAGGQRAVVLYVQADVIKIQDTGLVAELDIRKAPAFPRPRDVGNNEPVINGDEAGLHITVHVAVRIESDRAVSRAGRYQGFHGTVLYVHPVHVELFPGITLGRARQHGTVVEDTDTPLSICPTIIRSSGPILYASQHEDAGYTAGAYFRLDGAFVQQDIHRLHLHRCVA